ncbi:MAG: FKBP-type peptidyl-prolyl cis-trans isomerase [Bacteroidaceae bacterium]|nr:FKBP-type peptidyl-prolyl cis-trans isomerase [Bacteroidaceae bacterium]
MKLNIRHILRAVPHVLLLSLMAVTTIACQVIKEPSEYDNWEERNQAFIDSISDLSAGRVVASAADADAMQVGTYYAIETSASTNYKLQYIYVKKLLANSDGLRSYYTDAAFVYYYGTNILGERFDGNFTGFTAIDKRTLDGHENLPTQFNTPSKFNVDSSIIAGWKTALQYMREGERWIVFIPYQSAYGKNGSGNILGYSMLCFDMIVDQVIRQ